MTKTLDAADVTEDRANEAIAPETIDDKERKKGASAAASGKKLKLVLSEAEDSPLSYMLQKFKERDIKYDLGELIEEALLSVPKGWWEEKLDELTPLEFKIKAALEIPELREKLTDLLKTIP